MKNVLGSWKKLSVFILIVAIFTTVFAPTVSADFSGNIPIVNHKDLDANEKEFLSSLDYDNMEVYLKHLVNNIGSRFSGTPEEDVTVDYLMKELTSFGYEPWVEQFEMLRAGNATTPNYFNNGRLKVGSAEYNYYGVAWAATSNYAFYGDVTAPVKKLDWQEVQTNLLPEPGDCTGKIVIVSMSATGSVSTNRYRTIYADAIRKLSAAGAAGIVFVYLKPADDGNTSYARIATGVMSDLTAAVNIPLGCVKYLDAEKFLGAIGDATTITLNMELDKYAKNVFAYLPSATGSKKTIYISCHHDSVISGPGCNDNASGTAMTLEMARAFKQFKFDYNLMFMFFGAEENGLLGAYAYTNKMSTEEKQNFVANFNMDMVSTGEDVCNYIFINISDTRLQTLQDAISNNNVALKDNPAAVAIAEENIAYVASIKAAEKLNFPMENYFFCFDTTTDHYAFVVEGRKNNNEYPNMFNAIEYDWRSNRRGTGFEVLYHKVGDTVELNYNRNRAQSQGDIIALAIYDTARIINDPGTDPMAIEVGVPQIVSGFAANVPVNVAGADLGEVAVQIKSQTEPVVVYGEAKRNGEGQIIVSIGAEKQIPAGNYQVLAVGANEKQCETVLKVVDLPSNLWNPVLRKSGESAIVEFVSKATFEASLKKITVKNAAGDVTAVANDLVREIEDGLGVELGYALQNGDVVTMKGVKFAELFPSYSFTFTLS